MADFSIIVQFGYSVDLTLIENSLDEISGNVQQLSDQQHQINKDIDEVSFQLSQHKENKNPHIVEIGKISSFDDLINEYSIYKYSIQDVKPGWISYGYLIVTESVYPNNTARVRQTRFEGDTILTRTGVKPPQETTVIWDSDWELMTSGNISLPTNLLKNSGFENPDNGNINELFDWQFPTLQWFNAYYGISLGSIGDTHYNRRADVDFFTNGNGVEIKDVLTGKYTGRIPSAETGGVYQIVDVEENETYVYGCDIAFKRANTANQSIKTTDTVKILSPDGMTLYGEAPVQTSPQSVWNIIHVEGEVTIPAGVTQIRYQIDQVNQSAPNSSPIMCFDECFFYKKTNFATLQQLNSLLTKLLESGKFTPAVDLTSTEEVLTGELFNGKPVYAKTFKGTLMMDSEGDNFIGAIDFDILETAWLDDSNSFYSWQTNGQKFSFLHYLITTSGANPAGNSPAIGVTFDSDIYLTGGNKLNANRNIYYNVRIKYIKK